MSLIEPVNNVWNHWHFETACMSSLNAFCISCPSKPTILSHYFWKVLCIFPFVVNLQYHAIMFFFFKHTGDCMSCTSWYAVYLVSLLILLSICSNSHTQFPTSSYFCHSCRLVRFFLTLLSVAWCPGGLKRLACLQREWDGDVSAGTEYSERQRKSGGRNVCF